MKKPKQASGSESPYRPTPALVNYVYQRLQLESKRQYLTVAGKPLPQDMERKFANSARMKNHVLNKIVFPSMANLVFFLQNVSAEPLLHDLFKDDILDLFGIYKYEIGDHLYSRSPVARLVAAALLGPTVDKTLKDYGYRLRLADIVQRKLNDKLNSALKAEFGKSEMLRLMKQDARRARALMQLCASRIPLEDDERTRKPDIPYFEVKEDDNGQPVVKAFTIGGEEIKDSALDSYLYD